MLFAYTCLFQDNNSFKAINPRMDGNGLDVNDSPLSFQRRDQATKLKDQGHSRPELLVKQLWIEEDAVLETDSGDSGAEDSETFSSANSCIRSHAENRLIETVQETDLWPSQVERSYSSSGYQSGRSSISVDELRSGDNVYSAGKYRIGGTVRAEPNAKSQGHSERPTTGFDKGKGHRPVERKKSHTDDLDIKSYIRRVVEEEFEQSKPKPKLVDVVIVYDRNDYDQVVEFRDKLEIMTLQWLGKRLKIELYDSEEYFSQSKVLAVKEVHQKCSLVLCYLTANFRSHELDFFIEESIALSRFHSSSDESCIIKAVHTLPKHRRNYDTPAGLASTNAIDWFDSDSSFTRDKIIALMRLAISRRKRDTKDKEQRAQFRFALDHRSHTRNLPHQHEPTVSRSLFRHRASSGGYQQMGAHQHHLITPQNMLHQRHWDGPAQQSISKTHSAPSMLHPSSASPIRLQPSAYSQAPANQRQTLAVPNVSVRRHSDDILGRDGLDSVGSSDSGSVGERHDTPDSSELSVVSGVTGYLTTSPNLETDDVEIDTPGALTDHVVQRSSKSDKTSRHKSQVSVNLAFEDSSSDDDAFHVTSQIKGQQEGATYNIIGSHIVQIGTQNTVRNQNKHDIFSVSRKTDAKAGEQLPSSLYNKPSVKSSPPIDNDEGKLPDVARSAFKDYDSDSDNPPNPSESVVIQSVTGRTGEKHITYSSDRSPRVLTNEFTFHPQKFDNNLDAGDSDTDDDELNISIVNSLDSCDSDFSDSELFDTEVEPIKAPFLFSRQTAGNVLHALFSAKSAPQQRDGSGSPNTRHSSDVD